MQSFGGRGDKRAIIRNTNKLELRNYELYAQTSLLWKLHENKLKMKCNSGNCSYVFGNIPNI